MKVQLPDETVIFHTEVQADDSRKPMHYRLAGYNGFLINLHEMPVYCNVLYLHPNAGRDDNGHYAYKGMGYEYTLHYKVLRLIEIDGQSILEKQAPGLLPFTPLMEAPEGMDANRWLEKCIDATASASIDQHTRDILLAALGIFGGLVYEPQLIKQFLPEGIMQESPFFQHVIQEATTKAKKEAYKEGMKQGMEQGMEQGIEQGMEQGMEQGEKKGTIQSIIALLERQFQPDAVQVLEPTLEGIDDLQRLRELLLAASQVNSLETFMQFLTNGNATESGNGFQ